MRIRQKIKVPPQGANKLEIDLNEKPWYKWPKLYCLAEVAAEFLERDYGTKESSSSCIKMEVDEQNEKAAYKKRKSVFERGECSTSTTQVTPKLPPEFEDHIKAMNGRDPILVMEKILCDCDVRPGQNRLSIPKTQATALEKFLTPEEKMMLLIRDEKDNKLVGIKVVLIDPGLRAWNVPFKRWPSSSDKSYSYVLIGPWVGIVKKNDLKEGDKVQVWCFRYSDSELGFALVLVERSKHEEGLEIIPLEKKVVVVEVPSENKGFEFSWGAKRRRGSNFVRK